MSETHTSDPPLLCECGDPDCPGGVPIRNPFRFAVDQVSLDINDAELYLCVRTTSWEYDGERTDLHDLLSLLWAASLRVREAASVRLVTMLNDFTGIESEIYARYLTLDQSGTLPQVRSLRTRSEALSVESLAIGDLVADAFGVLSGAERARAGTTYSPEPDWVATVRRRLRLPETRDYEVRLRAYPKWTYFGSNKRGVTLADIGDGPAAVLLERFAGFHPKSASGVDAQLFRTERLMNAPSLKALALLRWLLQQVDGEAGDPLVIPTDSHLIGIGRRSLAAVRVLGGRDSFEAAREELAARRADEADLLHDDHLCEWAEKIDDARFERFVEDLLTVERGVRRVRQVGATREPDDGRDLMAEWSTPPDRGGNARRSESETNLSTIRDVLVQVKVRQSGVGRADLPGLRDTLEHYLCGGLLIVAFPRITVPLINHLTELRRRGPWWIDWWGRTELEERVRRHPEVAARYADIVRLNAPANLGDRTD